MRREHRKYIYRQSSVSFTNCKCGRDGGSSRKGISTPSRPGDRKLRSAHSALLQVFLPSHYDRSETSDRLPSLQRAAHRCNARFWAKHAQLRHHCLPLHGERPALEESVPRSVPLAACPASVVRLLSHLPSLSPEHTMARQELADKPVYLAATPSNPRFDVWDQGPRPLSLLAPLPRTLPFRAQLSTLKRTHLSPDKQHDWGDPRDHLQGFSRHRIRGRADPEER